jgi:serine/threonine protein kinase
MMSKFEFMRRLGAGYFGEVWLVRDTGLDVRRALKLIPPSRLPDRTHFFQEAQILKAAEHPNVVRVDEAGTMTDGRVYVAMEFLRRGSLEDEARGGYVGLRRARGVMVDVLRGLEYAHSKSIIHRDIKPANILVGDCEEGKLSDFGLAVTSASGVSVPPVQNYAYVAHLAPEVYLSRTYSVASDIYACGVTLYRLVNGDSYLGSLSNDEIVEQATAGRYPNRNVYREFIPRSLRSVINRAMEVNPSKRFASASQMRHALEQVPLHLDWHERAAPGARRWRARLADRLVEVERRTEDDVQWSVTVRRGAVDGPLRRLTPLSRENLSEKAAVRHTSAVLQDYVLGKNNP